MSLFVHILIFLVSSAIIWFFAGIVLGAVERVARKFNQTGFTVAFFILGIVTSISEMSVAVNSTIEGVPEVSAGNLMGASFVLLLFVIPLLAVIGNGIEIRHTLSRRNMQLALFAIILPILLVIDGNASRTEGALALIAYLTLLFAVRGQKDSVGEVREIEKGLVRGAGKGIVEYAKIIVGGIFIFLAGHLMVDQAVYFAEVLSVPGSLIGLILLSVGTNVPELVIAARSLIRKRKDVAFGDYIGSAATNTPIFGFLVLANGAFAVEASQFLGTAILMFLGLIFFYMFSRSKHRLSRGEGLALLFFYAMFVLIQSLNIVRFGTD